jgi:dihydroorotate dehydrogenase electron transfer subunit
MIWVPGVDEFPLSLLPARSGDLVKILVKPVGEGTRALVKKKIGDLIGVRGPYGNAFTIGNSTRPLLVAGGTGVVPLISLLHELPSTRFSPIFIIGARAKADLPSLSEIEKLLPADKLIICTDDGSAGIKSLASTAAQKIVESNSVDSIFACGPELMLSKILKIAIEKRIPFQASLERYFKCGCGICGSCAMGRYLVCRDGPVFDGITLSNVPEFGTKTRDASGKLKPIAE